MLAAAGTVLAMAVLAGCSATQASGGGATASPGPAVSSGIAAAPSSGASGPAGSGSSGASGGTGAAGGPAGSGAAGSGTQAGCAAWPAGSARAILSITAASSGKTYCVRTGETVQVLLSGSLALADGSQPPQLSGDALAASPARQRQMVRMPAVSYTAVHPGTSVLTIARLPCHAIHPAQGSPAASPPAAAGALARPATPGAAETAYSATASHAALSAWSAVAVSGGGAPIGTNCATQQVLRVFIVVR